MNEQRRSPRIAVDLPARVRTFTRSLDGRAGNLSGSGMLFVGGLVPHLDAEVEIDLPGGSIGLHAEVRWTSGGTAGIHFTERSRRLLKFVMERAEGG